MDGATVLLAVLALAIGIALGQWMAEIRRAQHDARKAWRQRKDYRR